MNKIFQFSNTFKPRSFIQGATRRCLARNKKRSFKADAIVKEKRYLNTKYRNIPVTTAFYFNLTDF